MNLDAASRARAKLPQQSYPDVCFAIHDFEDSFEEIVLTQPDDCYCVLLHAVTQLASTAPPQLPPQQQAANAELRSAADGSASASTASGGGPWATPFRHPLQLPGDGSPITSSHGAACVSPTTQQQQQQHSEWRRKLFGGYLSHLQMNASLNPGHNGGLLDTLVRMAQSHSQHRDCIQLAGPGGVGLLELAVARLYCLPPSPPRPRPPAASGAVVAETATQRQQLEAAGAQMDELAGVDAGWQEVAPPPASAKGAQQGGGGGGGSAGRGGGVLQRAQLLASGVFRGIAQAKAQIQEQRTAVCHFQCALTSLRLPVFAVARTILDSVLAEQDGLTQ